MQCFSYRWRATLHKVEGLPSKRQYNNNIILVTECFVVVIPQNQNVCVYDYSSFLVHGVDIKAQNVTVSAKFKVFCESSECARFPIYAASCNYFYEFVCIVHGSHVAVMIRLCFAFYSW